MIKTIYESKDFKKKNERKALIKQIIGRDERIIDCYEYFNGMYTVLTITNNHIVWNYTIDCNCDNVEYDLKLMVRKD